MKEILIVCSKEKFPASEIDFLKSRLICEGFSVFLIKGF